MSYYYGKNKAKMLFLKRDYLRALGCYSQLYDKITQDLDTLDPNSPKKTKKSNELKTIELLCILTDMALEHEEEARALFEYYQVLRAKKNVEAENIIMEMVKNFDKNLYELSLVIANIQDIDIDKNDGILYKDFKDLENKVGFKEAFEDLMFSSKIIFTNKKDFLQFIKNLIDFGFEDIAMNYFENTGSFLFFDKDFLNFYKKILQNQKTS